jgi:hypothetical protein
VGHKCHLEIARFDCQYVFLESSGLSAPHNARSEIDKIGTVVYNNGRRGARTIWVRHRCARAEQHYPSSRCLLARRVTG